MASWCIGIDLGGTFIKFALLDRAMAVRASSQCPTPAEKGADGAIEAIVAGGRRLLAEAGVSAGDVAGVGIGSPGPLDLDAGVVIGMPNIPGFDNVPLRDRVSAGLGLPAVLENDANAAALGEFLAGSGRGVRNMVLLTLGTGIGSGIIVDGKLLHGAHGIGAEAGHLIVQPGGEPCGCGQRGCLERYASATYLSEYARRCIEQDGREGRLAEVLRRRGAIDARDVQAAARDGDALAREVWDRAVRYLAIACVGLCRLLDPDRIVLGGGMAKAGEALMAPLQEHFQAEHWTLTEPKTALALAELGNDAGVIGAAGAAWETFGGHGPADPAGAE